jgi:hypothetical protein
MMSKSKRADTTSPNNAKNQPATSHTSRKTYFLRSTIFCLAIVGLFILKYPSFIEYNTHREGDIVVKFDDTITAPLQPEHERIEGQDHFYILPPTNATFNGEPKGVLLYLHSCKQSGLDFFTLPEHRIIALDAIQKGLVVFSPTSRNRESGCYTSEDTKDGHLERIVETFLETYELDRLPRVGLGDSSGGAFLSFVHRALKLESMAVYNSPQGYDDMLSEDDEVIPTVYLTMPIDKSISNRMNANVIRLQEMNIASYLYKVSPKPFTNSLCAARLPEITGVFCEHAFETIAKHHSSLLDADGYVLEGDVQSAQWQRFFERLESDYESISSTDGKGRRHLNKHKRKIIGKKKKKSPPEATRSWLRVILEQEIQTCYGFHAMTAQFHNEILKFLISNSKMVLDKPTSHRKHNYKIDNLVP